MGLFGYNNKDFRKNTEEIKVRLQEMMYRVGSRYDINKVLNKILFDLDAYPYPKGSTASNKELAAIDKRIFTLLDSMMDDIQREEYEKFSAHAVFVADEIKRCRQFGKEIFTAEQVRAQEIIAETRAGMFRELANKAKIIERMAEIEELAKEADPNSFEYSKLDTEYGELEIKLKTAEHNCEVYRDRHNSNARILATQEEGNLYINLPEKLETPQQLEKEIAKISELASRETDYVESVNTAIDEHEQERDAQRGRVSTKTSGLGAKLAADRANTMAEEIDHAEVGAEPQRSSSSLGSRIGR